MRVQVALYKKPPAFKEDWKYWLSHYLICIRTFSKYSHGELVIDGISYSSSARDGGVRSKLIEFKPERWDIFDISPEVIDSTKSLSFFNKHKDSKYDWRNILRYILPFVGNSKNKFVCFEFMGAMLNFAGNHKLTGNDWYKWAKNNRLVILEDHNEKD